MYFGKKKTRRSAGKNSNCNKITHPILVPLSLSLS